MRACCFGLPHFAWEPGLLKRGTATHFLLTGGTLADQDQILPPVQLRSKGLGAFRAFGFQEGEGLVFGAGRVFIVFDSVPCCLQEARGVE